MDAHLFRRLCQDLAPALIGVRIEKIYQIDNNITVFNLYGLGMLATNHEIPLMPFQNQKKHFLILKEGKQNPLLFVATERTNTGMPAPAGIMRLRKYLTGKRIERVHVKWVTRQLYMEIQGNTWICLDLRNGVQLIFERPNDIFPAPPVLPETRLLPFALSHQISPALNDKDFPQLWARFQELHAWCMQDDENKEHWYAYPVLTPLLRKTIPYLSIEEGAALYADLQYGGGDIYVYKQNAYKDLPQLMHAYAWELPPLLANKLYPHKEHTQLLHFEDVFEALSLVGNDLFLHVKSQEKDRHVKTFTAEVKRLKRLEKKLDEEETRLTKMVSKKELALAIQTHLYALQGNAKQHELILMDYEQNELKIPLDPARSIKENMEYFFHAANRGKRGLEYLEKRRQAVHDQIVDTEREKLQENALHGTQKVQNTQKKEHINKISKIGTNTSKNPLPQKRKHATKFPSQIQVFQSSDAFLILRGRDTKGNGLILKMASPHDVWVHIAQGASAHVIIRRDHQSQEIPQKTLEEAGILAALKSHSKHDDKAEIQHSLAKYIRPMKNSTAGLVHVDKSEGTFFVKINPNLETELLV